MLIERCVLLVPHRPLFRSPRRQPAGRKIDGCVLLLSFPLECQEQQAAGGHCVVVARCEKRPGQGGCVQGAENEGEVY